MELNSRPLVSVIMPAYNAEKFIQQAISSVLTQSITDLELIVIDDCSCDRTQELIADFAQKDTRVRFLVNEQNMGVAKTRNRGLDLCQGKYVAFLDSDDYWYPNLLESMIERANATNADIVFCSYEIVDKDGKKVCNDFIVPEKTTFQESIIRSVITCSTVLMSASVANEKRFPTNMYHEDIALWFSLLRDGAKAYGVPKVLAAYRQGRDTRSANKFKSACRRWSIYHKYLGFSVAKSMLLMLQYAYFGVKKYKKM